MADIKKKTKKKNVSTSHTSTIQVHQCHAWGCVEAFTTVLLKMESLDPHFRFLDVRFISIPPWLCFLSITACLPICMSVCLSICQSVYCPDSHARPTVPTDAVCIVPACLTDCISVCLPSAPHLLAVTNVQIAMLGQRHPLLGDLKPRLHRGESRANKLVYTTSM